MHDGTLYLDWRQPGRFMPSLDLHPRTVRNNLTKGPRIPIMEAGALGMALALSLGGSLRGMGSASIPFVKRLCWVGHPLPGKTIPRDKTAHYK